MPSYWAEIKDQKIVEYCKSWYRRKSESEWIDSNDLPPFREMLQRVSAKLNTMPWERVANVTRGFRSVSRRCITHFFCRLRRNGR